MKFISRYIVYFIVATVVFCASNIKWHGDHWKSIIEFDGKGYYAYLPSIFIYHDLQYGFFESVEKKYHSCNECADYRENIHGKIVDKYYAGVAMAASPFFLIAHTIT
ncbi:MAG TPA: hypothetical protein VII99_02590, partial [Bacteroidia bacterium]